MSGDWEARMQHLIDAVGHGTITSEVVVDQVYAKYQELREDLVLHGGGQHHYCRDALYEQLDEVKGAWADALVTVEGSRIRDGGRDAAEVIARGVFERAPFEFGDLKGSPHPTAADNGAVYYDRAPAVHRLSEDELRAKGHLRALGFGNASRITPDIADELGVS